jgi:hypothetical protein
MSVNPCATKKFTAHSIPVGRKRPRNKTDMFFSNFLRVILSILLTYGKDNLSIVYIQEKSKIRMIILRLYGGGGQIKFSIEYAKIKLTCFFEFYA